MRKNKKGTARLQQQKSNRVLWLLGACAAFIVLTAIFAISQNHSSASSDAPPATGVNENDIAALQAAERGALDMPALIWFHAPWCEICQALKRQRTVSALEKQYAGKVRVVLVDISTDSGQSYTGKYRVFGTPTWVLFNPTGQVVTQFSGWHGSSTVARMLDRILAN